MNAEDRPIRIGKYEVLRELGHGATSRVFHARDPVTGQDVAIKLYPGTLADPQMHSRFQRMFLNEAFLAGKTRHPHIAGIYEAVADEDQSYIVMEFVRGTTLQTFCQPGHLLPVDRALEIVWKCGKALEFAQGCGVIHRDIKPDNILVTDSLEIKISDFGSSLLRRSEHTQVGRVGSPAYMSPEQIQDHPFLTHQTDIYSLGVVLYKLLTGIVPFEAGDLTSLMYQILYSMPVPPSAHRPDIPETVDRIVLRALEKEPGRRFGTWLEFGREIAHTYSALKISGEGQSDAEKYSALRGLPFFRDFTELEIWETMRIGIWLRVGPQAAIIREGDIGDSFYVLTAGEVQVTRAGRLLNVLRPGDCFGEMIYFETPTARRSTSIASLTTVTAIEIRAVSLLHASEAVQVEFNKSFLRVLIDRLTFANSRLAEAR